MKIRKLLDLFEAAPPQAGAVAAFGKNPNAPVAGTAQPAAPAAQTKTYGGGYDPTKVQYAYGGKPPPTASATQSAALDTAKAGVIGGAMKSTPTASATQSAALDTAKAGVIGGTTQPVTPATTASVGGGFKGGGYGSVGTGNQTATAPASTQTSDQIATAALNTQDAAPSTDTRGAAAMASKSAPVQATTQNAPAQTSDQIATAALNAPAQNTSGTSLGRQAAFGQMAEDELEEDLDEELAEMMRLSGLTLNEKAVSKQQQKFMGMVHAMQKGEKVKGASPELKKAAKSMGKKDAKDFASTKHKGLPSKVSEEQIDPTSPGSTYVHSQRNLTNQDGEENFSRRTATLKTDLAGNQTVRAMDTSRPLGDEMTINANIPKGVKVNMIPQKVNEGMDIMLDEDGHTLKHIVNRFKHETKNFMNTGFMAENLYDALYDYYLDRGDMPYGIAKAREGDPYEWVEEHFYADMGSQMSEGAMAEQTVDPLSELARLAGLSEDGPGSAMLNAPKKDVETFGDKMRSAGKSIRQAIDRATLPKGMHAEYDRIEAEKDKRAAAPIATPATTKADAFKDAMGSGSASAAAAERPVDLPTYPHDKVRDNPGLKENDELNQMRRIAGLKECGDMGMDSHSMQKDRLNVSTNMSSDGTKDVTINAQGDQADALLQMLKMAGMRPHDDHEEPEIVMVSGDEEMMEADRVSEYENTPEEEYQTVDSIIRQGNDLNREKRQYADKPKLGDNPMAESILDQDLNDILESILIRDDRDSQNPIRLTPKSYDPEKGADWSGYNITSPNTGRIGARMEPGKETEYYAADPLPPDDVTGATIKNHGKDVEWHRGSEVDEGWEDIKTGVSDFVGDMFNTDDSIRRRSGQFRDLEAMQQKYKPGTPEYDQLEMRKNKQKERYYGDQGEVVDKTGEPIKVLPPDQWKGGK